MEDNTKVTYLSTLLFISLVTLLMFGKVSTVGVPKEKGKAYIAQYEQLRIEL